MGWIADYLWGIECQHGLHQGKPGCIIQISKEINDQIFPDLFTFLLRLFIGFFGTLGSSIFIFISYQLPFVCCISFFKFKI